MPKRAQKSQETRPVSFRMPLHVYNGLSSVAEARGVDLSAVLNWICAKHLPELLLQKKEQDVAMLRAAASDLSEGLLFKVGAEEALRIVNDLLRQLKDVYAALTRQALDEEGRGSAAQASKRGRAAG
jgi:hypothetical protein